MRSAIRTLLCCFVGAGVVACSASADPLAAARAAEGADAAALPAAAAESLTATAAITALADIGGEGEVRLEHGGEFVRLVANIRRLENGLCGGHIRSGTDCGERGGHVDPTVSYHDSPDEPAALRHVGELDHLLSRGGLARHHRIDPMFGLDREEGVTGPIAFICKDRDPLLPQPAGDSGQPISYGLLQAGNVS